MLQPLDIGGFGSLAIACKSGVYRANRLCDGYSVNKTDSLELYLQARKEAVTPEIIQKAWAKAGLSRFQPQLALKDHELKEQLPHPDQSKYYNIAICPTTLPERTVVYSGPDGGFETALTPANTAEKQTLIHKASKGVAINVVGKLCKSSKESNS